MPDARQTDIADFLPGGAFQKHPDFDGNTYDRSLDLVRLKGVLRAVFSVMCDGDWKTLSQISQEAEQFSGRRCPEAGVSARLRDLRKDKFGGFTVESRRADGGDGTWVYRLITKSDAGAAKGA